jgi:hypothetical protein
MNLATLLEGPANVTHRGQTFHFKGGLTLTPLADMFSIDSDLYGPLDQRALDNSVILTGTPIGEWTALALAVLHRWTSPVIGQLVTPRYDVATVAADTDVITLVGAAAPRTGCPVRFCLFPSAAVPTGLSEATTYFWGVAGTLHDTEAHAIAATNKVDITAVGSGDFAIIEQEYVQIDCLAANRRITFWNGAVTGMPSIIHSAIASMLGAVSFGCFRKNNAPWSDANSLYTVTKMALADTTPPVVANVPTQEYSLAFGAAPWDTFKSRGPITLNPQLKTEPIVTDGRGTLGLRISGLDVGATFSPMGFSEQQMLDLLGMQGGAVARGATRVRGDLIITGTGVYTKVCNAAPRQLPQTFSPTGPRAGELEARGAATTSGSRFFVGVASP